MTNKSSGSIFGRIRHGLESYIEARIHLVQLETTEKIARLMGMISVVVFAVLIFTLVALCLSLMAGYYFAQLLNSYFYGFAVVAGFYLLMLILVLALRGKLATFITNKVIEAIFNRTAEKEDQ